MNDIILECLETVKDKDIKNELNLSEFNIREDYSINRSFRRGSSTSAQLVGVPKDIVELVNRWKKTERSKGRKAKFSMVDTYTDIELLIPKMVKYSAML